MTSTTSPLRLFISSPGDVAEERLIARRVVERIRATFGGGPVLEAVFWEHEPLVATASFQDQITRPSETDIVICILWSRLGTRLPPDFRRGDGTTYASGTEFEFEDAVAGFRRNGRPDLMVYRKTAPLALPIGDDPLALERISQKRALDAFMQRWFHDAADGHLRAAFHPFETSSEFEDALDAHIRKLIARRRPELGGVSAKGATWRKGSPFRGLEAFGAEHAEVFFGRTNAVSACLVALRQQQLAGRPFLLIIGMSGSGKSSLVQAGLLPMLTQPGVIEGVTAWRTATIRPAEGAGNLVGLLAAAVAAASGDPGAAPAGGLRDDPGGCAARLARTRSAAAMPEVVVAIDQLEEAFSDERVTDEERTAFFAAVDALCRTAGIWIIATLRSDYYRRCVEQEELVELKEGAGTYDLLPPRASEIGQMIRLPSAAAGLGFETDAVTGEGLDEQIRDAALRSPEALPLLEFALTELYERRSTNGMLTYFGYEEIGGVEGALARRAEQVFAALSTDVQAALPALFRLLITISEAGEVSFSRRATRVAELSSPAIRGLAESLVNARLLLSTGDSTGAPVITVAHEALLRFWPRLRAWLQENQELLLLRARVETAAERWVREGRSGDLLLARGKPLDEARAVRDAGFELDSAQSDLILESERKARRGQRLRYAAVSGLALLAIAAGTAAIIANQQRRLAERQATTARETTRFMVDMFELADPDQSRGNRITVREVLDSATVQVKRDLATEPGIRASLLTAMGQAYTGLGLYEPAYALLNDAAQLPERSVDGSQRARIRLVLADTHYLAGDYEAAEKLFRDLVANSPGTGALASAALNGLADCLVQRDELLEAEQRYRAAIEIDRSVGGVQSPDLARSLNGLARLKYFDGRYDEAQPLFSAALRIRERAFGMDHASVAEVRNNLASLDYQAGRYGSATAAWAQVLPVYRKIYGADHPELATLLNNLGRSLLMQGDVAGAGPMFREALEIDRARKAGDHDDLVAPLNSLGMIELAQGNLATAEQHFREAHRIAVERNHWLLNQVVLNMADAAARRGDREAARLHLAEASRLLADQYPRGADPAEEWRWAILDSIEAYLDAPREGSTGRLRASLDILSTRFGANGLYARDALKRLETAQNIPPGRQRS